MEYNICIRSGWNCKKQDVGPDRKMPLMDLYVNGIMTVSRCKQFHLAEKERKMNRVITYTLMSLLLLALGCASTPTPKRGPFNSAFVTDGVYEGSSTIWPVKAVVKVAVENRRIARIDILEHRTMLGGPAEEIIPARIIEKQSTNVDVVSGATMSSDAIMNAVQLAIEGASKVE
ncbi:MAG: FMN-binding protein [Desulfobacterales bacterium]